MKAIKYAKLISADLAVVAITVMVAYALGGPEGGV